MNLFLQFWDRTDSIAIETGSTLQSVRERTGFLVYLLIFLILFSALVFPRSKPARALLYVADNQEIVLCDRNIVELRDKLIPAVDHAEKLIRDAKDQPILNATIVSDVDIILTGDKDFLSLDMEHPKCMTVAQFLKVRAWKNSLCAL